MNLARVASGALPLLALLLYCCTTEPVPTLPMEPLGPDTLGQHQTGTFGFYTLTDRVERVRYIAYWGDDVTDSSGFVSAGDTAELTHAWSDTGSFSVECRAQTDAGKLSELSSAHPVRIYNRTPAAPAAVVGPYQVKVDSAAKFATVTTDPESDSIRYTFDWGNGDTANTPGFASGDTARLLHFWSAPGEYEVRSMATDAAGNKSDWSPPHGVVVAP